jgi:hypothetical protein
MDAASTFYLQYNCEGEPDGCPFVRRASPHLRRAYDAAGNGDLHGTPVALLGLFEGDFPGDPGFRLTIQAFETVGVKPAVTAFKNALAVFPNSRPPNDIEKRLDAFLSIPYSRRQRIDETFWNATDEIVRQQAKYIRDHRDAFSQLKLRVTANRNEQ